jgi:hypothetical protein
MVPTTESVAFFNASSTVFAEWLFAELARDGATWTQRELVLRELTEILRLLSSRADVGVVAIRCCRHRVGPPYCPTPARDRRWPDTVDRCASIEV